MTESEVDPLKAFADELTALKTKSGATLKAITQLSGKHGLARSTIHQKLAGQTSPDWKFVEAFVRACAAHAGAAGRQLAAADIDIDSWRVKHRAMLAALVSSRPQRLRAAAALRQTVETFDSQRAAYQQNLIKLYRRLDLALLTPNEQDEHRPFLLRSLFIPQFVRAELQTVDLPKEMMRRLAESGELGEDFPGGGDVRRARAGQRIRPSPEPILRVLGDATRRLVVILGNPGLGKSTLARYLVLALAGEAHTEELAGLAGWLPLLVELRSYAEPPWRDRTFLDFIEHLHESEDRGLPKAPLDAYLRGDGRAVVVFDGLDELFDPAFQDTVTRQIIAFAGRYPRVRIVVTSRPIGYRKTPLDGAGFGHYTIDELDEDQIKQFVEIWYTVACPDDPAEADRRRKRVLAAVEDSPSLRELAGNPLLLTILTIIGRREELPRDRHRVYEHAAKVLVERWDVQRHLRDSRVDTSFIEWEDKIELLQRVARRLQETRSGNTGNHISGADLMAEFDACLQEGHLLGPAQTKPVARAMIKQLHERNYVLSHFGADVYGFVHRAFLEYFSATDIVQRFRDDPDRTPQEFIIDVFGARWADPAWQEVLLLVAGMIPERFVAMVVDHLLTTHPLWFLDRDQQPRHIVLAIRCLGEVRKIGTLAPQCQAVTNAVISVSETLRAGRHEFIDYTRTSSAAESICNAALPIVTAAGNRWPGRERYWSWLRRAMARRYGRYWTSPLGPFAAELVRLAAAMGAGDADMRQLLVAMAADSDEDTRQAATEALIAGWGDDPATPALLRQQAAHDPGWFARLSAVKALATHYAADPLTLALLRARATCEADETVLSAVIRAVVTLARDEPATVSLLQQLAGSVDTDTRHAALSVLNDEWGSDPDVAMRLRESAFDDPHEQVRAFAIGTVARDGASDAETRAWLRTRTRDWHPAVRTAAIEALATGHTSENQDPELQEWLRRSAIEDPDPDVRQAAIEAVASNQPDDADVAAWLHTLAAGDDTPARLAALKALEAGWADDPATLALLTRQALHDPDNDVRRAAVDALSARRHSDDDSTLPLLMRLGTDHDVEVRRSAADAVAAGWLGAPVVGAWLRDRADTDLDPVVRRTTMAALITGCARDPETASWLQARLIAEPDPATQLAIVHALAAGWRHDPPTMSWLSERATTDLRSDVRAAIMTTITTAWPPRDDWLPLVRDRAAEDPKEDVRTAAVQALAVGWLDEPGTVPLLQDRAVGDNAPIVRAAAVLAIAAGGPDNPDTLMFLRERIGIDPDELVRQHVVNALHIGWLHDSEIGRLLREIASSDPDEDVRRAAVEAVVARHAIEPAMPAWLRRLATTDPHPAVRTIAIQAMGIGWHDEPGTLPFLLDHAAAERDADVRLIIANHLAIPLNHAPLWLLQDVAVTADHDDRRQVLQHVAAGWRHDPAVGAWLAFRATYDLHHEVRLAAVEALIAGWQDDPEARSTIRDRADSDPHADVRSRATYALRTIGA